MPIISRVEGKSVRGRIIYAVLFTLLTLGGATMIYPMIVMISGSLRSQMDQDDLDLVPDYMVEEDVLYRKFLETKYNGDITQLARSHQRFAFNFRDAAVPQRLSSQELEDFGSFMSGTDIPRHWGSLGGMTDASRKIAPKNLRDLRDELKDRFDGDLAALGRDLGTNVPLWNSVILTPLQWSDRQFDFVDNTLYTAYFAMQEQAPLAELIFVNISGRFLELMILPTYGRFDTKRYNETHAKPIERYDGFTLPQRLPGEDEPKLRQEWLDFVRNDLHPSFIALDNVSDQQFQQFVLGKYGDIEAVSQAWGVALDDAGQIRLPQGDWLAGTRRVDYLEFLLELPSETYRLIGPEYAWHDFLEAEYATVAALNAAHGTGYARFEQARMPVDQLEYAFVQANPGSLRWEYATRNYVNVMREMIFQGWAFFNTVVVCVGTIVLVLLVNPMAAYALSRFQLPGTYKILLLLMATMAFPGMVILVPKFLILRNLNMLNSYWALILPFLANGYQIFLLKGFFDSLPRDLYEAATLDGAGELRMFFQITMALSKPILAVVALGAFTAAYTMFLYALIVCPDQDMWTINVWLYQWQQTSPQGGVFASLLIAAIPTLLVFLFAQNIIMRGIVVPTEK